MILFLTGLLAGLIASRIYHRCVITRMHGDCVLASKTEFGRGYSQGYLVGASDKVAIKCKRVTNERDLS